MKRKTSSSKAAAQPSDVSIPDYSGWTPEQIAGQIKLDLMNKVPPALYHVATIKVQGALPSLNAVFSLGHWERKRKKREIADAFMCALRATGTDSSTPTTPSKSSMSTFVDTLACYLVTNRGSVRSKTGNSKYRTQSQRKRSLKSSRLNKSLLKKLKW